MDAKFTIEGSRDFSQRYGESYGWLPREGKPDLPVYIRNVDGGTLYFEDLDENQYHVFADKDVSFKFHQMRRALYVGGSGRVYVIERRPARQWQRGVSRNNTNLFVYNADRRRFDPSRIGHGTMRDIMAKGSKPSVPGVIMSDIFCILHDTVYMYYTPIGAASNLDGTWSVTLSPKFASFKQELSDAARDSKTKFTFV